jgi:hypothetical protein
LINKQCITVKLGFKLYSKIGTVIIHAALRNLNLSIHVLNRSKGQRKMDWGKNTKFHFFVDRRVGIALEVLFAKDSAGLMAEGEVVVTGVTADSTSIYFRLLFSGKIHFFDSKRNRKLLITKVEFIQMG